MKRILFVLLMFMTVNVYAGMKIKTYSPNYKTTEAWTAEYDNRFSTGTHKAVFILNPAILVLDTTTFYWVDENSTVLINKSKNMKAQNSDASYFKMGLKIFIEYFK